MVRAIHVSGWEIEERPEKFIAENGFAYPKTVSEANFLVNVIFPGVGMRVNWAKYRFGPYKWRGEILCPVVPERALTSTCVEGYDVAAALWKFFFGNEYMCRGIASDVYGWPTGLPEEYEQVNVDV